VSKGIGNMKETSETAENIRNVAELWKKLIQIMMGSSRMRIVFNAASDRH
jgi:dihydropteroate synthase